MFDQKFKSLNEIDRVFIDHIESLEMAGIPFDRDSLVDQWNDARAAFSNGQ
jgi:hypothetical protein